MEKRDKIINRISSVISQKYPDAEIYLYGSRARGGAINEKLILRDRVWTCEKCKTEHDRYILAARNILRYCFQKQYKIGQGLSESTLSEKAMPSVI